MTLAIRTRLLCQGKPFVNKKIYQDRDVTMSSAWRPNSSMSKYAVVVAIDLWPRNRAAGSTLPDLREMILAMDRRVVWQEAPLSIEDGNMPRKYFLKTRCTELLSIGSRRFRELLASGRKTNGLSSFRDFR